jgi:hypothetical protein
VKRFVARLRDDLVDDLDSWVCRQPLRDLFPQLIPLLRHGRGEDFDPIELAVVAAA